MLPEANPAQLVEAAAYGGFDMGGMWAERESWTPATTRAVRRQCGEAGVKLLDLEVAWIMPGPPDPWLTELVHIAAELGARNLLCVSSDPDMAATTAKFQTLVDAAKGTGVRVSNIEPGLCESEFSLVRFGGDQARYDATYAGAEPIQPQDIAETIFWIMNQPAHININSLELMPVSQDWAGFSIDRSKG